MSKTKQPQPQPKSGSKTAAIIRAYDSGGLGSDNDIKDFLNWKHGWNLTHRYVAARIRHWRPDLRSEDRLAAAKKACKARVKRYKALLAAAVKELKKLEG